MQRQTFSFFQMIVYFSNYIFILVSTVIGCVKFTVIFFVE